MPSLVEVSQLKPLLDEVGPEGVNLPHALSVGAGYRCGYRNWHPHYR